MELKTDLVSQRQSYLPTFLDNLIVEYFPPKFKHDASAITLLYPMHFLKNSHPHYKYFLADENEKKENIVILLDSVKNKRIITATVIFFSYNIIKQILWSRGYFAYFFYHTRLYSFVLYYIAINLINKNNEAHLMENNLIRYRERRINSKFIEEHIRLQDEKRKLLEMKDQFKMNH
jgi:hypothetical protein